MAKKATKKMTAKKATSKKSWAAPKKPAMTAKPVVAPIKKTRLASRPKNGASYTQSEFIENIRGFCGLPKRSSAKELAEDLACFIVDALRKGYKLPLLGLGKMYVRQTKARIGRNPATGEMIQIAPKKRVRFAPAKALKEAVL